jgi:hypothetical protein
MSSKTSKENQVNSQYRKKEKGKEKKKKKVLSTTLRP